MFEISHQIKIAESDAGYEYFVARLQVRPAANGFEKTNGHEFGARFIGLWKRAADNGEQTVAAMAEVSEDGILGVTSLSRAYLMASAILVASNVLPTPDRWFIGESLRGDPEDYRCPICGRVCCWECGTARWDTQWLELM